MGGHVARMTREEMHAGVWRKNLRNRNHFEDLDVEGRITLKWILKKSVWRAWTDVAQETEICGLL
jgi:hypothetical protein